MGMRCLVCYRFVGTWHDPTGCCPGAPLGPLTKRDVRQLLNHGRSWNLPWGHALGTLFKRPPRGVLPGSLHERAEYRFFESLEANTCTLFRTPPLLFVDTPKRMNMLKNRLNAAITLENATEFPPGMYRLTKPPKYVWN